MQSNDARMLLHSAVPTAVAGAVGAVVGGVLDGGQGVLGAVIGAVVVILFMGVGLYVLQRTARSLPHLFQAMGLLLYTTQILLLAVVLIAFRDTTFFNDKVFAFTLLGTTLVWVAAQARAHSTAKMLYVQPDSSRGDAGSTAATGANS